MRVVVVGLIALPVVVGGLGIAAAVVALGPPQIPSAPDQNMTVAAAIPDGDQPDNRSGTAIDGSRPYLTVSDGGRTITLPGAIPAMLSVLPSPSFDLPPLVQEIPGQGGTAPDPTASAAVPTAPAVVPPAPPVPGPAGVTPPPIDGRGALVGGPPGATPHPPVGIERDDSRATAAGLPSPPSTEPPRDSGPGRGAGHPGPGEGPPAHADEQGRPGHADTTGPPPHASDNARGDGAPGGPGDRRNDRGDERGGERGGERGDGRGPDHRPTPR